MKYSVRNRVLALVAAVTLIAVVLVGILLSGGGNGYDVLMKALRKQIFETENVTINAKLGLKAAGSAAYDVAYEYKKSGDDYYKKTSGTDYLTPSEVYAIGNETYSAIDHETKQYSKYKSYGNLTGILTAEGDIGEQVFDIGEMFVNLAAGSAKSLIVNAGTKDGETTYTVNMAESQFPQVAEAIINLANSMISANADSDYNLGVKYEDYDEAVKSFYKQKTGSDLDELVINNYWRNNELNAAYSGMFAEMYEQNKALLAARPESSIMFVPVSGEPVFFADYAEFCLSGYNSSDIEVNGTELCVKGFNVTNVNAEAKVDSEGRLTYVNAVVCIDLFDYADKAYAAEVHFTADLSGYGSTVVALPDLTGYTDRATIEKQKAAYEDKTCTVSFDGSEYEITVSERVATEEVE